jgi:erythromycin esterase-like protein
MSEHEDTSPVTRLRRSLQAGAAVAAHTATTAAERADVVGTLARAGRTGGERLKQATAAIGATVNRGVGKAAGSLTLGEYRDEVDRALAEASEVIAAQAAQIAELEARLAEFARREESSGA